MHVTYFRVGDEFQFALSLEEPGKPLSAEATWQRVAVSYVEQAGQLCPKTLDLCAYSYGRGFYRSVRGDDDLQWQYASFGVLNLAVGDAGPREIKMFEELRLASQDETALGYLLAELRVMGEQKGVKYAKKVLQTA